MTHPTFPDSGFLSDASSELKRVLTSLSSDIHIKAGEVLFEQGDLLGPPMDSLYLLVRAASRQ